jgi:hypothetical protein
MTALSEILGRVEAATGPDRELFGAVANALDDQNAPDWANWWARFNALCDAEAWTDAALALVERALPDPFWMFAKGRTRPDEPLFGFVLYEGEWDFNPETALGVGEHDDRCLAILAALLKALIASEATAAPKTETSEKEG